MATEQIKTTTTMLDLEFVLQQETKGAVRYGEKLPNGKIAAAPNDPGACVGTLYVRKTAFDNPNASFPKELTVKIVG